MILKCRKICFRLSSLFQCDDLNVFLWSRLDFKSKVYKVKPAIGGGGIPKVMFLQIFHVIVCIKVDFIHRNYPLMYMSAWKRITVFMNTISFMNTSVRNTNVCPFFLANNVASFKLYLAFHSFWFCKWLFKCYNINFLRFMRRSLCFFFASFSLKTIL